VDAFGGKRELGESSLEAAVRETFEESGGALCLDDVRRFVRLPALDLRRVSRK
jgi:8-oxo-dGTP pyrophosphatase MutT (NUDIX family)